MIVKNYMFSQVCTVSPEMTLKELVKLMVEKGTNSVIVIDEEQKPIGVISSRTLIRETVPEHLKSDPMFSQFGREGTLDHYVKKAQDKKVKDMMHTDFHILSDEDAIIEAASYSIKSTRRILPVVHGDGKLVGAVTRTCIKNALYNILFKDKKINPQNGGCACQDLNKEKNN